MTTISTGIDLQNLTLGNAEAMNQLESLATELLLNILFQLPDLVSLESILRASPVISLVFNDNAVKITEVLLIIIRTDTWAHPGHHPHYSSYSILNPPNTKSS